MANNSDGWHVTSAPGAWLYTDWAQARGDQNPGVAFYLSVKPDHRTMTVAAFEAQALAGVTVDAPVLALLRAAWTQGGAALVIANGVLSDAAALEVWFDIHHIGPPVPMAGAAWVQFDAPKVGVVIDDGLPYLSPRFAAGGTSRFQSVWLQGTTQPGVVLDQPMLKSLMDESAAAEVYARINRAHLAGEGRMTVEQRASHGAAVCALAFQGGDPAMDALPLLGVQLPPRVIADSSGQRTEGHILTGLMWVMHQALVQDSPPELVVNLSVGALAGPDGPSMLARWLDALTALYQSVAGKPLHLVCAYGNAWRGNLVARYNGAYTLDWRVLPEDHSSSALELRSDDAAAVTVRVTPPGGPVLEFAPGDGAADLLDNGKVIARVSRLSQDGDDRITVMAAATADRFGGGGLAPAGRWQVQVVAGARTATTVKILRDDTPAGYRLLGRQSYFDHPQAHGWDAETGDYTLPGDGPITRAGTAASHVGMTSSTVYFVGARTGTTGQPSRYTAAGQTGAPGNLAGPWTSEIADDTPIRIGVRCAPVLGRGGARLSGTSAAAPILARRILLEGVPAVDDSIPRDTRLGWAS